MLWEGPIEAFGFGFQITYWGSSSLVSGLEVTRVLEEASFIVMLLPWILWSFHKCTEITEHWPVTFLLLLIDDNLIRACCTPEQWHCIW